MNTKKIFILYASQTGNAMDVAERIGREAERRGGDSVVLSIDGFDVDRLNREEMVIFVVSTTGQGDVPDTMKVFWRFLLQRRLGQDWLTGVHYAVFGLGDSGYQKYNFVAKKLDSRLTSLGAKPVIEKGLGDDQHPSGYEGALDTWMFLLWSNLNKHITNFLPKDFEILALNAKRSSPKINIIYNITDTNMDSDIRTSELLLERVRTLSAGKFWHKKAIPVCFLKMIKNVRLTRPGCGKDVRHFEFEAPSSDLHYDIGDVVEILPKQNSFAVDAFIKRCNLDPETFITVHNREKHNSLHNSAANNEVIIPIKLKTFVEFSMDVASASPRRYFFEVMSYFAEAEHEKERLEYFASPEGREELYRYNEKEGRCVLEVLEDFPSVHLPFEWLVQLVPPLKTRAFSIASSSFAHPNQLHLTVNVVSWITPFKRNRSGLCSSWLADIDPDQTSGEMIPAWVHKGALPRPPDSEPLILIGPGTGCAPFRGFVEERAMKKKTGADVGGVYMYFGCRKEVDDYLYKDFWKYHSSGGGVMCREGGGGLSVAFSREGERKVYVQDKMRDEGGEIWRMLKNGACVYVAGSATKMPADVVCAFEDVVSKHGGVSKEAAGRWVRQLERAGKYHVEAWS